MDWAAFFKDYSTLITAITGIVGIVLTYFFTKGHYERSRKWELEDRDYKRHVEIHDKNVREARAYVDALLLHFNHLSNLLSTLQGSSPDTEDEWDSYQEILKQILEQIDTLGIQSLSIDVLNDDILDFLHRKMLSVAGDTEYMVEAGIDFVRGNRTRIDSKKLENMRQGIMQAMHMTVPMKHRLDELAQIEF